MEIRITCKHSVVMRKFVPGFQEEMEKQCKKEKVEYKMEFFENEFIINMIGEEKKIQKIYDETEKSVGGSGLKEKTVLKLMGIKIKLEMKEVD